MSTAAPGSRLGWRLLPAVIAGAAMVVAASIVIQALRAHPIVISRRDAPAAAVAEIDATRWDMRVFPVGTHGGLSKPQRKRFEAQRVKVAKIVRKVFGALAGEPGLDAIVSKHFTPAAAKALVRTKAALPRGTTKVELGRRSASIGIQGTPPRAAAARVKVSGRAEIEGRSYKWSDRATFWMRRGKSGWRVIAFDLRRSRS